MKTLIFINWGFWYWGFNLWFLLMEVAGFLCLCVGLLMDLIFFLIHEYMCDHGSCSARKHGYGNLGAILVPSTAGVQVLPGYRCMHTPDAPHFFQKKIQVRVRYGSGTGWVRAEKKTAKTTSFFQKKLKPYRIFSWLWVCRHSLELGTGLSRSIFLSLYCPYSVAILSSPHSTGHEAALEWNFQLYRCLLLHLTIQSCYGFWLVLSALAFDFISFNKISRDLMEAWASGGKKIKQTNWKCGKVKKSWWDLE